MYCTYRKQAKNRRKTGERQEKDRRKAGERQEKRRKAEERLENDREKQVILKSGVSIYSTVGVGE
jgi:hypothetical protein